MLRIFATFLILTLGAPGAWAGDCGPSGDCGDCSAKSWCRSHPHCTSHHSCKTHTACNTHHCSHRHHCCHHRHHCCHHRHHCCHHRHCCEKLPCCAHLAPSAQIPPRTEPQSPAPQKPQLNQSMQRTNPTICEETQAACASFGEVYRKHKSPRLLILFNRNMEDSEGCMVKTGRIEYGVSGKDGSRRYREQGGITTYAPAAAGEAETCSIDVPAMEAAFSKPFAASGAKLIDRDTAVRMYGINEDAVFSYTGLPETQQAQVKAVARYADIIITVSACEGEAIVRKVAGDYVVDMPNIVAKAICLRTGSVLATATSGDVRADASQTDTAQRVAAALMTKLASCW